MNLFTYSKKLKDAAAEWAFSDNVLPNAGIFEMQIRCGGSVVYGNVEENSFASYNKTTEPLEITALLAFSGSDSYLQSVLARLKMLKESVTTFSIETPTYEYENFTLEHYDYALRREDGRGALYINAIFIEIKEVSVSYTDTTITAADTKDASATNSVNGGLKQGQEPTDSQKPKTQSVLRKIATGTALG